MKINKNYFAFKTNKRIKPQGVWHKYKTKVEIKPKKKKVLKKRKFDATRVLAWEVSGRFASHMGRKFSLSSSEVKKNRSAHYRQCLNDKVFFNELVKQYGDE